ncbi:DivIVA domain-containing protein [Corynebacterium frankenforstense]
MLSWIFLIVVLVLLVIVGTWIAGRLLGRGEPEPAADPEEVAAANERAVAAGDLDAVRFELVPRGYRPEQVEAVLDQLAGRGAARQEDAEVRPGDRVRPGEADARSDDRAVRPEGGAAASGPRGWAQADDGISGRK